MIDWDLVGLRKLNYPRRSTPLERGGGFFLLSNPQPLITLFSITTWLPSPLSGKPKYIDMNCLNSQSSYITVSCKFGDSGPLPSMYVLVQFDPR